MRIKKKIVKIVMILAIFTLIFLSAIALYAFMYKYFKSLKYSSSDKDVVKYIDCFYFSAVTFFTVGYGDIYPFYKLGKILAISEGYIGILYNIIFGGFLLDTLFNVTDLLLDIAKDDYVFPHNYKCYPSNKEIDEVEPGTGEFNVKLLESDESWCSSVIHIYTKQNWEWLASKGRRLFIKLQATGIKEIKLELKGEAQGRLDHFNISLNETNNFTLDKELLKINEYRNNWKSVTEVCFVVIKQDVTDSDAYYKIEDIKFKKSK